MALHGGAGTITRSMLSAEKEQEYRAALEAALEAGYSILKMGGSALDAVTATVVSLEDCPLFNAGRGSVYTHTKTHEMDAAIMNGSNLMAGAVTGVNSIRNPILAARKVMENSDHVLLSGNGAEEFALSQGLIFEVQKWFDTDFRYNQLMQIIDSEKTQLDHTAAASENKAGYTAENKARFGTVGAVAMDADGNLAAATSTGGMTNKRYGRIGDSPIIGAGTYANNQTCAISATGYGEFFMRYVVAYDISALMDYGNFTLKEASNRVIMQKLALACPDSGGVIGIDYQGNIVMPFNSEGMYRASVHSNGERFVGIYRE